MRRFSHSLVFNCHQLLNVSPLFLRKLQAFDKYLSPLWWAEMEKVGDTGDISLLFFQLVLIFGPFWVILGHFGNFGSFLGHYGLFWAIFRPFFGANFFWPKM